LHVTELLFDEPVQSFLKFEWVVQIDELLCDEFAILRDVLRQAMMSCRMVASVKGAR
jgi:hypothetical protein